MKNYKRFIALFLSMIMLVSAIPISVIAEENAKVCTDLYDSLSLTGELKAIDGDTISKSATEMPLTEGFIMDIDSDEILKSRNLSSDNINSLKKLSYSYNSDIMYEAEFDNGAVVSLNQNMDIVAYSDFGRNNMNSQAIISKQNLLNENDVTIEVLKSEYNIDDSYKLDITEDNGDIKYYWSKIGYNDIANPYDSLSVRVDGMTGKIVTFNRFDDAFEKN